jgi:hypothetical protein
MIVRTGGDNGTRKRNPQNQRTQQGINPDYSAAHKVTVDDLRDGERYHHGKHSNQQPVFDSVDCPYQTKKASLAHNKFDLLRTGLL